LSVLAFYTNIFVLLKVGMLEADMPVFELLNNF